MRALATPRSFLALRTLLALAFVTCLAGAGSGDPYRATSTALRKASTAGNAEIEASLGNVLQQPVFQCGTGVDTQTADAAPGSVKVFETGPVRPIALSADGQRLFVANAPANCLEIYSVQGDSVTLASSVAVGLEPVAIAERNAREVWVVNHLSDSVSIVRLDGSPRVLRTLAVGDEPRDIVFAGPNRDRAFITAATRGQNRPNLPANWLTTPGLGRADVWVYDAANLDDTLSGKPLTIVTMFADTPRALAVSNDGNTVYASPFMSGNGTTTLHRDAVFNNKPGPFKSADGVTAPDTGLIVKYDGAAWRDERGEDWSNRLKFSLPDYDLFSISASAATPKVTGQVSGIGTTLFNIAVNPATGLLYVSNTDAINQVRFEGPGLKASTVRGHIAESRISVVNLSTAASCAGGTGGAACAGAVEAVHLNSHVNFSLPQGQAIAATDKEKSLAQPTAMTFNPGGDTLYVAAFGSAKVAVLPTTSLTKTGFVPDSARHIAVPDGPSGLALNASGSRLYVYSRIAHSISVIDTVSKSVLKSASLFSPESTAVKNGRRFLYDANATSANGTSSCASCHIFGDMDHLAWDLGNPDDVMKTNTNAYVRNSPQTTPKFHPMKGPMTTQTLRGMAGNGPTHWRGDRTATNRVVVRGALESVEEASFKEFNPAFVALVGKQSELSAADMQSFTDFAMALTPPPNPVRALDGSLNASQKAGRDIYFNVSSITGLGACNDCHRLNPAGKQFGTSGLMSFEGFRVSENFKVPQLRNVYQKVGMFGFSGDAFQTPTGPQIRGYGFVNDGSIDTLDNFFKDVVFRFPAPGDVTRAQVIDFVLAFDSDLAPVVGQQATWRPGAGTDVESRITLFKQQASLGSPACELVVRGSMSGVVYRGLYQSDGSWLMKSGSKLTDAALRALASPSQPLTMSCVPPGSGKRIAFDGAVTSSIVIEFYNTTLDNYFVTADAQEAAAIDNGSAGPGWIRTGGTFAAGGSIAVCRFYGSQTPGPNSHFYTADAGECAELKQLQATTPSSQKRWNYESLDFFTNAATNKTCAAGMTPIYRAYNNGFTREIDSNHRITASRAAINEVVVGKGWSDEGVVMCAPGT